MKRKEPKTWEHPRLYMGDDNDLRIIYPSGRGDWVCPDEEDWDSYNFVNDYACWTSELDDSLTVASNQTFKPKIANDSRKNMFAYHKEKGNKIIFIGEIK